MGLEPRFLGHSVRSVVNIWTELYVTAWSIRRQGCTSQPGQYTDRDARHILVNIPTELQVTAWSTYRPRCTSQPGQHTDRAARHSLANIPTELHVTTWPIYRLSCTLQPGQYTDRAACHNLANILTELHVTALSTYRPSCTSPYTARNIDTDISTDLTHPRHFRQGSYEWCLTNVNVTLYIQISSKSFDQVGRHRTKHSTARNISNLPFCFKRHAIKIT